MSQLPTVSELLGDPSRGLVSQVREAQLRMASSVDDVLANGGIYAADAPTGTGKSLAYLVPALLAEGKRIIIATAKKSLQDQLEKKDVPTLAAALGMQPKAIHPLSMVNGVPFHLVRVLKGKANYTCRLLAEKRNPGPSYEMFLAGSAFGDVADYPTSPPPWWSEATPEECTGRACKHYSKCGYIKLRAEVVQTRVVVVNHALLGLDMFFARGQGGGKVLGGPFDVLIVDEAHQLHKGIRDAFTTKVEENALVDLDRQIRRTSFIATRHRNMAQLYADMFAALPNAHWREQHDREIPVFPRYAEDVIAALEGVDDELAAIMRPYGVSGNPDDIGFNEAFGKVLEMIPEEDVKIHLMILAGVRRKVATLQQGIRTMQGEGVRQGKDEPEEEWLARNNRALGNTYVSASRDRRNNLRLLAAPIEVGGLVRGYFEKIGTVVVTSATLAVDGKFDHVENTIGVPFTKAEVLPATFDYQKQGLLFIPRDIPDDPAAAINRRIDYCEQLAKWSNGGAFILTTSYDDLDLITEALKGRLSLPVFAQDSSRRTWDGKAEQVLERFKSTPDAVLVGTKSFWEGVDIPGEALRLLVISKLPFPNPKDPLIKAKHRRDGATWRNVDYVEMMIELRQGAGRLIRTAFDRGVLALLDSRLWTKPYGKGIRNALGFPLTDDLNHCKSTLPKILNYYKRAQIGQ